MTVTVPSLGCRQAAIEEPVVEGRAINVIAHVPFVRKTIGCPSTGVPRSPTTATFSLGRLPVGTHEVLVTLLDNSRILANEPAARSLWSSLLVVEFAGPVPMGRLPDVLPPQPTANEPAHVEVPLDDFYFGGPFPATDGSLGCAPELVRSEWQGEVYVVELERPRLEQPCPEPTREPLRFSLGALAPGNYAVHVRLQEPGAAEQGAIWSARRFGVQTSAAKVTGRVEWRNTGPDNEVETWFVGRSWAGCTPTLESVERGAGTLSYRLGLAEPCDLGNQFFAVRLGPFSTTSGREVFEILLLRENEQPLVLHEHEQFRYPNWFRDTAMLSGWRFFVTVAWRDESGALRAATPVRPPGASQGVPLDSDSAIFWFFDRNNWEVTVKVLDACAINGRFWFFAAAMTELDVEVAVRDSWTGQLEVFEVEGPSAFRDLDSFPCDSEQPQGPQTPGS